MVIVVVGIAIAVTWFLAAKEPSPDQTALGNAKIPADLALSLNQTNIGNAKIPADLALLITRFRSDLVALGISIIPAKNTAPWSDESCLTADERKDPGVQANIRAINETMKHIWFFAQTEEQDFIGYWRGPNDRDIGDSPLVSYDSEGQFHEHASILSCLSWYAIGSPQIASIRSQLEQSGAVSSPRSGSSDPSPSAFHLQCYEAFKAKP